MTDDGTPFVFWNSQWYPICGHYFWDSNVGASLICQKFGYQSGRVFRKPEEKYSVDSFKIGRCNPGDKWENCTGACNDYRIGGYCGNENKFDVSNGNDGAKCMANHGPKITIECLGKQGKATTSCHGGKSLFRTVIIVQANILR